MYKVLHAEEHKTLQAQSSHQIAGANHLVALQQIRTAYCIIVTAALTCLYKMAPFCRVIKAAALCSHVLFCKYLAAISVVKVHKFHCNA